MAVNQLKAGAVLNYVSLALSGLVGIAYTPFMLRMLGQSEYGLYSLAASIISYLSILDFGFGNAVIRYTAKFRAEGKTEEQYSMFGMFTVLYSVIGVITIIAGMVLYWNIDNMFGATFTAAELSRTRVIILLMIFNLAFTFPLSIYGAIITAYEDFIFLRVVQIARTILNMAVMICLLLFGYKAIAMVVVQTVFNFVTLGLNVFYCKNKIHIRVKFARVNWGFLKEVSIYSFWIFLNVIMDRIYWSTGQFVLGVTSGTVAVSVFAVAIQLEGIYMMFSGAISGVFLPRVTAMVAKKDDNKNISDLFIRTGRIQYIILSFILCGFIVFGRQFIHIWAGPVYDDAYIITLLFFISLTIPLVQNLGITILQARNEMKFRSLVYITIAVISLVFQIPLAKLYGGVGVSISIASALIIGQGVVMNIYYYKKQKLDIITFFKEISKMSIIPIIVTILFLVIDNIIDIKISISSLILEIAIFSIIYFPLLWKFSMNSYERNMLSRPILNIIIRADKN
jgi:O-antigen/teichoic acid export membrane protein